LPESHQLCDELYTEWARNSCHGYADKVFVAEKKDKIIGFTTARVHGDAKKHANLRLGEVEFGCVHPEFQGLGVFSSLMNYCMNWLKDRADVVLAKTLINNFFVQITCQKLGFELAQTQCTFHKSFG
jgi:GNAT superfamily N-acetyltransferase